MATRHVWVPNWAEADQGREAETGESAEEGWEQQEVGALGLEAVTLG